MISKENELEKTLWAAHEREHMLHESAHAREHDMTAEALRKAEIALDKRLENMNQFRAQLNHQASTFVTRDVFDQYTQNIAKRADTDLSNAVEKYETVLKSVINRHDVDFENLREALQQEREIRKTFEGSLNTFKYLVGLFGLSGLASIVFLYIRS